MQILLKLWMYCLLSIACKDLIHGLSLFDSILGNRVSTARLHNIVSFSGQKHKNKTCSSNIAFLHSGTKPNLNVYCTHKESQFFSEPMGTEKLKDSLATNKFDCENLLKRRFFYTSSFELYGGSSGLYDYGPPGCALKSELEKLWREHFVVFDEMLEVSCSCITPHPVLKSSGHVDRFTDLMVKNLSNGECYRADKYAEELLENVMASKDKNDLKSLNKKLEALSLHELDMLSKKVGVYTQPEMEDFFAEYEIKSPEGDQLSKPFPFNLMFSTNIGPKTDDAANSLAYLRPETAQGIFVNFVRLLEYNGGKVPFAAAQIGLGFRNEISPRNGLLRVREFTMAEIEYFVNPKSKTHEKYEEFKHVVLPLVTKTAQGEGNFVPVKLSMEEALEKRVVDNEALAYFLARTYLFLKRCGINEDGLRFRQHTANEMAHYASDCWDAEILTSYGWIEVVGHADRMAYDLTCHSKATNTQLVAHHRYPEPILVEKVRAKINKPLIGKTFTTSQKLVLDYLGNLSVEEGRALSKALSENPDGHVVKLDSREFKLTPEMVQLEFVETKVSDESFVPGVIEPSFGLGRLIYSILEHSFRVRPVDENVPEERSYLALNPSIAPTKCSILPLSAKEVFDPFIARVQRDLKRLAISHKVDKTGASIGKRYARTDEIGVPYCVTLDFQSLNDDSVTLRERDSMQQLRVRVDEVAELLSNLLRENVTWAEAAARYPNFTQQKLQ
ncbi:glycyl-tRNA synthetase [Theileria orientalis strain Shintoku]|uniref:glycine--tRNA ligase n=1 Tax=Theileria orientalis strain Shintoku TaxID=869250 RepID=J4DNG9_THEOR|nr:glycyl-tRNA synthetase [Theileria orientalis strain Shintoku]BAM38939.1 glycyl-tRNA synthetase [Theileria orientalis strain Shintoku]|eukprot:XP_009689240.1 glycyl-tRNA synthetase [Theileria orientalis strain Shintoku]